MERKINYFIFILFYFRFAFTNSTPEFNSSPFSTLLKLRFSPASLSTIWPP